ncbi:LacI family DNA-binding transcriptional regulator [Streptomyces ipomoeae]|uniref:Periplasmic binding protein and sugar binding domain of the LacI family protein n=1 Tax=Streptomyces ipomoeae 91-03 TaxID=698759 RepID=L1L7H2_9ACTN|nr:substrate-binding domain-containing protein [Streptomyces ipomoeae]EKX68650.1 periplasmic binding protein and sugar binding domain of the LacI family protein [Streptomyces ipomoeae 91-03]
MTPRGPATPAPDGGTHILGLVYPPAGRGHDYTGMQLAFIGGVAEAATTYDYDVLLSPANEVDDPSFQRMTDGRVDGVIVMEIKLEDERVEHLSRTGFPFVTIGRNSRAEETSWVDLDFAGLARGCVYHLADLGHRRIAFVNRSEQLFQRGYGFAHLGLEGYTKGMAEQVLTPHAYLCDDEVTAGEAVLEQILRDDPATTALVTLNEAALEGLYRGLIRHGRNVPRDFSVVGVAAGTWAEQVDPQLTAAEIPAKEMSRVAVELMVRRLTSPDAPPRHVLLKPLISLRGSTGPCRPVPGSEPEQEFPDLDHFPDLPDLPDLPGSDF